MRRPDLVSDCENCAALCCVAYAFQCSADFAFDKAAGERCWHLSDAQRCEIHAELPARGFAGCAQYDCYGAGQHLTRALRGVNCSDAQRIEAFLSLRDVHEWLWLLTEAAKLCPPSHADLREQLERETAALDALAAQPPLALTDFDQAPHRERVQRLLRNVGLALGGKRRGPKSLVVL